MENQGFIKPNETPGMDSSVVATKYPGLYQISTTDFFYPLVEDPRLQGRITCCNVLSDLYAMGVTEVDTILMLLGISTDMTADERDIVTTELMKGFAEVATEAGTSVTGGQTVQNPWPVIGGVAMSLRHETEFIRPDGAVPGDVLVLTKPLGIQLVSNMWQWRDIPEKWATISSVVTVEDAKRAYATACESMGRLNMNAAKAMHECGAHAATDITGFGLIGHARNLAKHTKAKVDIEITALPVIKGADAMDGHLGRRFGLRQGRAAETSGGLLVALPADQAEAYIAKVQAMDGKPAWVVGRVVEGKGNARISETADLIEVEWA